MSRFKELIDDLKENKVIEGPLGTEGATGWIHNPVISDKKYSDKIRLTLDTRPMADAVKTAHFPIPTPEELRHDFKDSDRFSILDLNHAFFQFPMDEETQKLYAFYTPWGLHRFTTLAMGVSSASAETHERLRIILYGTEGVGQIKDDLAVHGKGETGASLAKTGRTWNHTQLGEMQTGSTRNQMVRFHLFKRWNVK